MDIKEIKKEFVKIYGESDKDIRIFSSPGRVNLIGEHTDYNGGFVFPAALKVGTTIALRKREDNIIRLKATDLEDIVTAPIDKLEDYKDIPWGNYQLGVINFLKEEGYDICGADLLYDDSVPHGAGLSSSAAIEVSTAFAFATLSNEKNNIDKVDKIQMAKIAQKAEREFAGVNCGIMDQFASSMGEENHAIFLDCKDLSYQMVPLNLDGKKIIITNTHKKHSLGASKYNERRAQCEKGLEILKTVLKDKNFLGEISKEEFEKNKHLIDDEIILKRVKHVIYECDRVLRAVDALNKDDITLFGKLMNESHDSLKDDYEVSCKELDILVDLAREVKGTFGSRMTGAGFGGCTVSIVDENYTDEFMKNVAKGYEEKTGIKPSFYVTDAGNGAREIK